VRRIVASPTRRRAARRICDRYTSSSTAFQRACPSSRARSAFVLINAALLRAALLAACKPSSTAAAALELASCRDLIAASLTPILSLPGMLDER